MLLFGLSILVILPHTRCYSVHYERGDTSLGFLPGDLKPSHYEIELTPNFYTGDPPFFLSGSVDITFECIEESNILYLNAWNLDIHGSSIYVTVDPDSPIQVPDPGWSRWEIDETLLFFKLFMDDPLVQGAVYHVGMTYNTTVNFRDDGGITYGSYQSIIDGSTNYVLISQFQTHKCRKAFPAFDEAHLKATFSVTVLRKEPMIALNNMPLSYSENRADGWIADHFQTTVVMSSYLVSIAVGEFAFIESFTLSGTPVRVYGRQELLGDLVTAGDIAADIQDYFEEWTGREDPLPKIDHVEAPERGGAMEKWGLISYSEAGMYTNPAVDYVADAKGLASVMSHEVSHFWFGNLVTCQWWDDFWIHEGFASFFQQRTLSSVMGIPSDDYDFIQNLRGIMQQDSLNTSTTVWKYIENPVLAPGDGFTRKKGAGLLRMMRQFLGENTFRAGFTRYLDEFAFGTATTDEFLNVMTDQADIDGVLDTDGLKLFVKEKMDPWLYQQGYPVVTLTRTGANTVQATQTLFLSPPGQLMPESAYLYEWFVPLTIVNAETLDWSGTTKEWLNRENKTITVGLPSSTDQWFVANVDGQGFYRVKYDNITYQQLVDQLDTDASIIPHLTRYTILNDAFEYTRAGLEPEVYAMETTRFLDQEDNFVVWDTADMFLEYTSLMLARYPETFPAFQTYLRSKIDPVYNIYGWINDEEDTIYTQEMRGLILWLACSYGNQDCISEARTRFDAYKHDPNTFIPPDHRLTVQCTALRTAPQEDWDFLHAIYLNTTVLTNRWVPDEVDRLLTALACTENATLLQRYIDLSYDRDFITAEDDSTTIRAIAESGTGRWVLWEHMKANWDSDTLPQGVNRLTMLKVVSEGFSTAEDLADLEAFIQLNPPDGTSQEEAFSVALATATTNKQWADAHQSDLRNWLDSHVKIDETIAAAVTSGHSLRRTVLSRHDVRKLGAESVWYKEFEGTMRF